MATNYEKKGQGQAPQTVKQALKKMLEDLSKENFQRFCGELLDREDGPGRCQVEDKNRIEITHLLAQVYTTDRAPGVAAEILREIGCGEAAKLLDERTGGPSSAPGPTAPSSAGPSAVADNGCTAAPPSAGPPAVADNTGERFVDKHRDELIKRVGNIETIMDELLKEGVISDEIYADIKAKPTRQKKMRELYDSALNAKMRKDIFYKILERNEPHLIAELKKM